MSNLGNRNNLHPDCPTPIWKVLEGLNVPTGGTAPSLELAGGGCILYDDSLPFASLGSSHFGLKMPGQEKDSWGGVESRGESAEPPLPLLQRVTFRYLMYQVL